MKTGTVFIAAAAIILFGVYDYLKYKRSINALNEAVKLFNLFKNEIYYKGSDYNALCKSGGSQGFKNLIFKDSAILLYGITFSSIYFIPLDIIRVSAEFFLLLSSATVLNIS